ncbi:MAG: M13 family peptidase [Lactobacillus sp.]|jgi:putative endopeptidase|nr:M13 family peptidase [Lactobacillus sp.]MCH3905757.1 M13 family peptidase [Lactobacillus sp.]MCH3990674.1 M13 family peptidase [Lactobacillus sp.]MCH4068610.1 M13 family peptidase [Lactobacillus sp.]MCI1304095.1 M13 family peptidase [Lactobacillus sp.]
MLNKMQTIRGGAGDITKPADNIRPQDNLYLAVNSAWIKQAKIPADRPSTGSFDEISLAVEKHMLDDFADFASGKQELPDVPNFDKAVALYKLAGDFDKRNADGADPIRADLNLLRSLRDMSDFNLKAADLFKAGFTLPISFSVDADMKNTKINVLQTSGPDIFLPDKTQYGTKTGDHLQEILKQQTVKLLTMAGFTLDVARQITTVGMAYDAEVAAVVKSNEEWADYPASYNPMKTSDFVKQFADFKADYFLQELFGELPDRIIVQDPGYLKHANKLLSEPEFPKIKAWLLVKYINGAASYLSQEFREAAFPFSQALTGQKELTSQTKQAYHLANGMFSEVVGVYYGQKYFGEAAKKDVEDMIKRMLTVYEQRLANNNWLSKDTIEHAIVKLKALVLKIGYPDKIEEIYNRFQIVPASAGGSLYSNERAAAAVAVNYNLEQLHREVDRTLWAMPGNLVNACYDPARNDLTFPAAILQKPFYDVHQSRSANYGGIGTVIAHEISHAFDNNGAKFDEFGNMKNWWTKADFMEFEDRTKEEIALFDGLTYGTGKLNGKQIVSENIADQGGLTAAVEACKGEADCNLKELFTNFARVWADKMSPELMTTLLAVDVHAPGPLRANVQSQCQDDFYEAFDVKPGDGMYLDPTDRVKIW